MNAADILKYGHLTVLKSIAHLASYEYLLIDAMNTLIGDGPFPTLQK